MMPFSLSFILSRPISSPTDLKLGLVFSQDKTVINGKITIIHVFLSFLLFQSELLQQSEPENGLLGAKLDNGTQPSITTTSGSSQTTVMSQTMALTVVASSSASGIVAPSSVAAAIAEQKNQPKRLHVSNIPFRFRDPDLRAMFGVSICSFEIL
jgi:hypothetical protein